MYYAKAAFAAVAARRELRKEQRAFLIVHWEGAERKAIHRLNVGTLEGWY